MKRTISPLRYPGGKSRLSDFMEDLIILNNLEGTTLYEMYAGGAGASLNLLFSGVVSKIILNDLDIHVYAFWSSVLNDTENFIKMINDAEITMANWETQKAIYMNYEQHNLLEVGFSSFFLNRCNRSGVLNAGPIGGKNQTGNYKIDVRFNKPKLIERIEAIANKKDSIEVKNLETINFLEEIFNLDRNKTFVFLDPPYYVQGENLYYNFYEDKNHKELCDLLNSNHDKNWFLTYDNVERIRELYQNFKTAFLPMTYTLQEKKKSKEVMIFSNELYIPKNLRFGKKTKPLPLIS